jgi:hypothetical protein
MTGTDKQQECKNCGNNFSGSFCNVCGQRETHRITVAHVFHDMVHVFLHADKGIFPFMQRLFFSPGHMARDFIEGKRKMFNPFQYLIISVGIVLFLMTQTHFYETLAAHNNARSARFPTYFKKAMSDLNWFAKSYSNLITFISLPFYALFSWLAFKKRKHNYAEHFVMQVYSHSQINTITAIAFIVFLFSNSTSLGSVGITLVVTIFSFFLLYKQLYGLKWHTALWKSIVVFVGSYLTQIIVMGLGILVYVMILKSRGIK